MPDGRAPEIGVFAEDRYGLVQPRRPVTGVVVQELALALARHPDWQPGFPEVWDVRFCSVDLVPADIPLFVATENETEEALQGSATLVITHKPAIFYFVQFLSRVIGTLGRTLTGVNGGRAAADLLGVETIPDLQEGSSRVP